MNAAPLRSGKTSFPATRAASATLRCPMPSLFIRVHLWFILISASMAHAAWFDNAWSFRRSVDVAWNAEKGNGDELAMVEFHTAGHHAPGGEDIRVATENGRLVPSRVLMVGPGDHVRVIFTPAKNVRKYFVYFGNGTPAPPPKQVGEMKIQSGVLMEIKQSRAGASNFKEIENAWEKGDPILGATMIDRPFIGMNPIGDQDRTVSRLTGTLFAPVDGDYQFALSADDRGAFYLDGKPLIFSQHAPGDTRFNKTVTLQRGRHDFTLYHLNTGGDMRISLGWKRPDTAKIDIIEAEQFGRCLVGKPGPLDEIRKTLTADFRLDYLGECYFADGYSHRYRLTAIPPASGVKFTCEWDFGDGQTHAGSSVEHVYLTRGVYPVRLTMRIGGNSDTQTTRISVSRQFASLASPSVDQPPVHAHLIKGYDLDKMTSLALQRAVLLQERTDEMDDMLAAARALARHADQSERYDVRSALNALTEAGAALLVKNRVEDAVALWQSVPKNSRLQPRASIQLADYLLWRSADFARAVKLLEPLSREGDDVNIKRLLGQALVLDGRAEEGRALLASLPETGKPEQRQALMGALATTIEFFIHAEEADAGEEAWDRWQIQYPLSFLDGYSILLKTRLMELHGNPRSAARVAEGFALSVPRSSYAPRLLDRAATLFATIDPKKSSEIRQTLKEQYPEDPLAQE